MLHGFPLLLIINTSRFGSIFLRVIEIEFMSVSLLLLIKVAHVIFLGDRLERTHQFLTNVLETLFQGVPFENLF